MLRLNNLLSPQATWCQVLSHQWIRCFKEDFSHTQIPTDTDLERIIKHTPATGTKATPEDRMTIDEIRDMIQNDPRYDNLTAQQMDMVVRRETTRADFAYNMGIKPEEVDDGVVDLLMMEGYDKRFGFANGGGVGSLFKRKVA